MCCSNNTKVKKDLLNRRECVTRKQVQQNPTNIKPQTKDLRQNVVRQQTAEIFPGLSQARYNTHEEVLVPFEKKIIQTLQIYGRCIIKLSLRIKYIVKICSRFSKNLKK